MEKILILIIVFTAVLISFGRLRAALKSDPVKTCTCSCGGKYSNTCVCHSSENLSDSSREEVLDKHILEQV